MPVMRISLRADTPADTQRAIADGVHRAMVDALGLPEADRFQIIERLPAEALIADPGYLGVSRRNVVFVSQALEGDFATELENMAEEGLRRGVEVAQVVEDPAPFRQVFEPSHPDANAEGYVSYPNVNPVAEMVDLMTATRAYEANVQAVNATRKMADAALSIGG